MNKESHLVLEGITQTRDFENTQEWLTFKHNFYLSKSINHMRTSNPVYNKIELPFEEKNLIKPFND